MSFPTDERQQIQLELEGLKRTLEWTEIQREQLLDRLDLLRLDNARRRIAWRGWCVRSKGSSSNRRCSSRMLKSPPASFSHRSQEP